MKLKFICLAWCLLMTLASKAQSEHQISVTENISYRTDVGPSTVLDLAQPLFGPQQNRPAILIIHSCGGAQVLANAADARLKSYIILNAGMGTMTMADASSKSLKNLHAPILYLVGGTSDVAWKNAQMDYDAIKKIPVVLADNTQSGHGGTYEQPNGGANARMVRAWLDWQLKDRQENKSLFINGDLTGYDNFTIKHKNFK